MNIKIAGIVIFLLGTLGILLVIERASNLKANEPQERETSQTQTTPQVKILAINLNIPWALVFLPDGRIIITERPGTLKIIDLQGGIPKTISITQEVLPIGEGGLLGLTLHPNFNQNRFLYLYHTYSQTGQNTLNRVVRFKLENDTLADKQIIIESIPGASNHNGGRIKFGPDGFLYVGTGDAQNPSLSQDKNSLAGKILRITDDGQPAPGNPFGNLVYSYGHRNVQGLAWDSRGRLWATEHGQSAKDEVNQIQDGQNYGWPSISGDQKGEGMLNPFKHSGDQTWAPSGMAFLNNSLYFAGLRGQALFEINLQNKPVEVQALFKNEFGRIREVVADSAGNLYLLTNNTDGRGNPKEGDDKLIRINL